MTGRRPLLVGAAGLLGGCLSGGSESLRYRLAADNVPGSLADHLRWTARGPFAPERRELVDDLVASGSLTTVGVSLRPPGPDAARYVERDGAYYRISIDRGDRVERERWILWFDLVESLPDDAEVFSSSLGLGERTDLAAAYGLSERDVRAVRDATGEVFGEGGLRDLADAPPGRRGHVFRWRDPAETALLPDPPFTHVAFETSDGVRYARARTERAPVELRRYEHGVTRVATSPAAYRAHVRDRHLAATFDPETVPDDRRAILDAITRGGGEYEERTPLSDSMRAVLDSLGLAGVETPEPRGSAFSDVAYFRYDGFYGAELVVFR